MVKNSPNSSKSPDFEKLDIIPGTKYDKILSDLVRPKVKLSKFKVRARNPFSIFLGQYLVRDVDFKPVISAVQASHLLVRNEALHEHNIYKDSFATQYE